MSTEAIDALRAAITKALASDGMLVNLLGGAKVFDKREERVHVLEPPYVMIGDVFSDGTDHRVTIDGYSRRGPQDAHLIAGALLNALDDAPLTLEGPHRLVDMRFALADIRREKDSLTYHTITKFQAVTERVDGRT